MTISVSVEQHPVLDLAVFETVLPAALGDLEPAADLTNLLAIDAQAPMQSPAEVRLVVRDLLRHGGFKPTGRSKPASEYLIKAAGQGTLASINTAVDACNAVSLHSGLPISVVDLELVRAPLHVAIAPSGSSYVFNASGQRMDLGGLLCLFDAVGPCGNGVKDSQRTKTNDQTQRTLSLIWGTTDLPGRATETASWYRQLLESLGAKTQDVVLNVE